MGAAELKAALDKLYAGSEAGDKDRRTSWLKKSGRLQGQQRQLHQGRRRDVRRRPKDEAEEEELGGKHPARPTPAT
jgi:hypothetical protein